VHRGSEHARVADLYVQVNSAAQSLEADAEVQALKAGAVKASMSVENVMDKTVAETASAIEAAVGTAVSSSEAFSSTSAEGSTQAETSAEENVEAKEAASASTEEEAPKEEEAESSSKEETSSSSEDEEKPAATEISSSLKVAAHPLCIAAALGPMNAWKPRLVETAANTGEKRYGPANGSAPVSWVQKESSSSWQSVNPLFQTVSNLRTRGGRRGGLCGLPPLP